MMKQKLFLTIALLLGALSPHSVLGYHDFSAVAPTGQTLYYVIIDDTSVYVTCPSDNDGVCYSGFAKPTGDLIIPPTVTDDYWGTYSVNDIGPLAFVNCTGLTSVTIPNSVTSIGTGAFRFCTGLTSVTIPNSVTYIGDSAFFNCSSLAGTLTIPNSVTSIGQGAFHNCTNLNTINYNATNCSGYGYTINGSSSWLRGCSSLTRVNVGNNVRSIPENAFSNCTGLRVLDLGSGLTSVGANAFYNCDHLDSIYSRNNTPPTVANTNAFENVWKGLPLTVPTGSRNSYATAYAWRDFYNIVEGANLGIETTVTSDGVSVQSRNGHLLVTGASGLLVTLSDLQGRILYRGTATEPLTVEAPATGIYLLQVEGHPAHRISVVR